MIQTYNLNLVPQGNTVFVRASQYDKTSRTINMVVYNRNALYNIPENSVVTVRGTKPQDDTGFEYECTYNGSIVTFDIKDQMTVYAGQIPAEIRITKDGAILGSANFLFQIEPSPLTNDTVISETDLPLLQEAINSVDVVLSYRNEAESFKEDAEAWAVGQRNGEDVDSEDPTYENNSKYYSEQSQGSANDASDSAEEALQSANSALSYAQSASNSALLATQKADEANQSAIDARDEADSASEYAASAQQSASDASASAQDASDSATLAAQRASDASASATSASTSAASASNSAQSASTSATLASNKATEASGFASNASQSASLASQKATEASGYASNASASATQAAGSASSASASETNASASATSASESATASANSATEASASATSAETSAEQAEAVLEEVIGIRDNFAEKDGFYPDMSVGHLLSNTTVDDEFTYQVTNYDGKAQLNSIKGNTIKWNQLNDNSRQSAEYNGVTFTNNGDDSWNISGTASSNLAFNIGTAFKLGDQHVYYISGCPSGGSKTTYAFGVGGVSSDIGNGALWKNPSYTSGFPGIVVKNGITVNFTNLKFILCDLTLMFGSTKADEIYAMETAQAGSGVAYFKSLFPLPYYQYDAGSLLSFNGTGIKTVGKNQIDTSTAVSRTQYGITFTRNEDGSITVTGTSTASNSYTIASSTTLPLIYLVGGETYTIKDCNIRVNGNTVSAMASPQTYTAKSGDFVDMIWLYYANGVSVNKTLYPQMEIGTTATAYEPYTSSTSDIPTSTYFPNGMKDVPTAYDEMTNSRASTRIWEVDMGILNWQYDTTSYPSWPFFFAIDFSMRGGAWNSIACADYSLTSSQYDRSGDKVINATGYRGSKEINIRDSSYTDVETFKTAMSGKKLYFQLATPLENYGVVDMGTMTWETSGSAGKFFSTSIRSLIKKGSSGDYNHLLSDRFVSQNVASMSGLSDKGMSVDSGGNIQVYDSSFAGQSGATLQASLQGVYLLYELAEPVADLGLDLSYDIAKGGTEQLLPINTDVPVTSPLSRNVTFYYENEDVNNLTKILAMIAPVENKTVSKAYTVGQYLIYDYVLYKVTSNIANGGTITVGTNVTATSIASILESM